MTGNVDIKITGIQYTQGEEPVRTETRTIGRAFEKNEYGYVIFEETDQDMGKTNSRFKIGDSAFTYHKKGAMNCDFYLEEGCTHNTTLQTMFGGIPVSITTHSVRIIRETEKWYLKAEYDMTMEENYTCNSVIEAEITRQK